VDYFYGQLHRRIIASSADSHHLSLRLAIITWAISRARNLEVTTLTNVSSNKVQGGKSAWMREVSDWHTSGWSDNWHLPWPGVSFGEFWAASIEWSGSSHPHDVCYCPVDVVGSPRLQELL
jgi:hypothetical protein